MQRRRRTPADRRREFTEREEHVWRDFRPQLAALQTMNDAIALHAKAVPESAPGRRYYSNLGFFLMSTFQVPAGANEDERALYLEFMRRLGAAGSLPPEEVERIEEQFRHAAKR